MNRWRPGSVSGGMQARRPIVVQVLPLLAAAVLAVGGCSPGSVATAPKTSGPSAPGSASSAAPASPASPAGFTIQGYKFPALTATAGQEITVADGDDEPHTVTADDGSFDSGSFDKAAPGTLLAPKTPGVYPVHCTIHPSMHGMLTVR